MLNRDRNLLFGVFAVQLKRIPASKIMAAAGAWASEPDISLGDRLVELGAITDDDRVLIDGLVDNAVQAHGGDSSKALTSFGGEDAVADSFAGSLSMTDSGGVKTIATFDIDADYLELKDIPAVEETPGRYAYEKEHSRGGMGRILLVHDAHLDREIALKELLPFGDEGSSDPTPVRQSASILGRFLQEAKITGQLEHPSIVPVYEMGHREDGSLYYTMKLVRGKTLAESIKEAGSLEERLKLLPHFVDLCNAVAYAHSRGVIHRDLKPSNVMIGEFGETVVIDWGLAKVKDKKDVHAEPMDATVRAMFAGEDVAKTAYGEIMGTPAYMPPEQAKGDLNEVDEQSDVYSLGIVLYEILTGKIPFEKDSLKGLLKQVIDGKSVPIAQNEKDAPPELAAIATKAISVRKNGRYDSAVDLADEVGRYQLGALVTAYTYKAPALIARFLQRHRAVAYTGAVALLVLLTVGIYYNFKLQSYNLQLQDQNQELAERNYVSSMRLAQSYLDRNQPVMARDTLMNTPPHLRHWEWGYLYQAIDGSELTLVGHSDRLDSAVFSPDGTRVLTASHDRTAKVWDVYSGDLLMTLTGHDSGVNSAVFRPDGSRILTVSFGDAAKVWDAETGALIATLKGHGNLVYSASYSPDGFRILTTSSDDTSEVWDAETGGLLLTLKGHDDSVESAVYSPDGSRILTVADSTAKVWDAESGALLLTLTGHDLTVRSAVFSPDGYRILTASFDESAKVWDAVTGEILMTLTGHDTILQSAVYSPDASHILTTSNDKTAKLWDAETGELITTLKGHYGGVISAVYSPDGSRILTASFDGTAKVWEANVDDSLITLTAQGATVESAEYSPDGTRILTVAGSTAKVWDAETGHEIITHEGPGKRVHSAVYSPDGSRILIIPSKYFADVKDNTAKVWDVYSGDLLMTLTGHDSGVDSTVYSPDGSRILTVSLGDAAKVWDAETGELITTLKGHYGGVDRAVYSPDGSRILTDSWVEKAEVWDAETGGLLLTLNENTSDDKSTVYSPDGSRILSISFDNPVAVRHAETGELITTLKGHDDSVASAVYSPDGERILTASFDETAKVWDAESGALLLTLTGHDLAVRSAVFSPDGYRILTASQDSTAKVWGAAEWHTEAWTKDSSRASLLPLVLRHAPVISDIRHDPESGGATALLNELDEWGGRWRVSIDSLAARFVDRQGILIVDPDGNYSPTGLVFSKYDLITRINGKSLGSLEHATELLSESVSSYRADQSRGLQITFEVANFVEHRLIVFAIDGKS